MYKHDEVSSLSNSIWAEIRRVNSLYAPALLDKQGSRETWQAFMPIFGINSSHRASAAVNIYGLNRSFINTETALTALPNGYEINMTDPVASVAPVDIYENSARLNHHKSCGPGGVSAVVLKECDTFLSSALSNVLVQIDHGFTLLFNDRRSGALTGPGKP
ncbi:unnamed protein product [Echinostoma caproni]|uniref:Pili assembly chaperone n=1 Tax=Echinostoma caproni TaxID=27848 RepID=A0A183AVB6_9TREM|nr:unnamed protein product [Echinostoma caproni]